MDKMWSYEVTGSDFGDSSLSLEFILPSVSAIAQINLSQQVPFGDTPSSVSGHITSFTVHGKKRYYFADNDEPSPCMVAKEKFTDFTFDCDASGCNANWIVNIFFWKDVQVYATSRLVVATS